MADDEKSKTPSEKEPSFKQSKKEQQRLQQNWIYECNKLNKRFVYFLFFVKFEGFQIYKFMCIVDMQ